MDADILDSVGSIQQKAEETMAIAQTETILNEILIITSEVQYCMVIHPSYALCRIPSSIPPKVDLQTAQVLTNESADLGTLISDMSALCICQPVEEIWVRLRPIGGAMVVIIPIINDAHLLVLFDQLPRSNYIMHFIRNAAQKLAAIL
jgi:hypothetical protein